jgi:hypothetical protein
MIRAVNLKERDNMNGTPSGGQASPSDGGGPPKSRLERLTDSLDRLNRLVKWQYVLVGAILFLIGIAVLTDNAVVRRLTDPPFARGLITFIISVATIGLAFVLVCESFSATDKDDKFDERFRRAREILALLMGILGTIVGFYFGSAQQSNVGPLGIAQIKAADRQLITYVSGGSPPYRYSISSTDPAFKTIKDKTSQDGWIVEAFEQPFKLGSTVTVDATDSKDQTVSRRIDFPASTSTPTPPSTPAPTPTANASRLRPLV